MRLKTFVKAPIDLQSVIDPGRAFKSLRSRNTKNTIPKAFLLRETANWLETVERNSYSAANNNQPMRLPLLQTTQ